MTDFTKLTAGIFALAAAAAFSGPAFAQTKPLGKSEYTTKQNTQAPPGQKPTVGSAVNVESKTENKYIKRQNTRAPSGRKPTLSGAKKLEEMPKNKYIKSQDRRNNLSR